MSLLLQQAIQKIDEANQSHPEEVLYSQRMSQRLESFEPNASKVVQLAARAQHIQRWEIPRSDYPKGRAGYFKWRTTLYEFHAQKAGEILKEVGFDQPTIDQVQKLLRKKEIKVDPEMQLLEDVICLVFLEHYFTDFAQKHEEEKIIDIIQKTWKKMSEKGHQAALSLSFSDSINSLIQKALKP